MKPRHCFFLMLVLLVVPHCTFGQEELSDDQSINSVKELFQRVTNFYADPTEAEFTRIQEAMGRFQDQIRERNQRNGIMNLSATFLSRASKKYEFSFEGEGPLFDLANEILNESDTNEIAKFVNDDSNILPSKIDVWWVSFFATGDEKYLEKVLTQTLSGEDEGGIPTAVANSARWSFKANCKQHSAVLEFAKKAKEGEEWSEFNEFLAECIDQ